MSSVPKLVHEMSYCAGAFNSDDNIFLYGCDENRKYFIDKYDTSMGSGENILDCSAMSECNYDSFSDVFINSEGIIYAYKEESDNDKTFFVFNQNGRRISAIDADELPEFTYGSWFVKDIRYLLYAYTC